MRRIGPYVVNITFTQYNTLTPKAKNKLINCLYKFVERNLQIIFIIQLGSLFEVNEFFLLKYNGK